MPTPQQVSDSFKDRQTGRTISGARNIAVTSRKKAVNNNQKIFRPNTKHSERRIPLPQAVNDNRTTQSWLKKIEAGLEDTDIDDLEEYLEIYGDKLNEKTRGIIGKALLARKYWKVTLLNISIISWGMTLWLLQFKLALISIAVLGLGGAVDAVLSYIDPEDGNFIIRGTSKVFSLFSEAINFAVFKITDGAISINFDVETAVVLTILLPFLLGLTTLMIMSFQYQLTFVNCFGGKGAEYKMAAFIFAIFGYFTPILNLFPWFIFWLLAVWRYPK